MDTIVRRFAARLHNLRTEQNLSQEALAARAGLHATYISVLERAQQVPSLTTLELLAKGLKVDLLALLDFSESAKKDRLSEEIQLINKRLKHADLATVRRIRKAVEALTNP